MGSELRDQVLRGRYRLQRRLGRGGFAEVWLAEDLQLSQKPVAVKVLRVERSEKPDDIHRFEVEPQIVSRIRDIGGHIVDVTDSGYDSGIHYFVMEFIEGPTLREEIRARGRLRCPEALRIAAQLCDGIAVAHAHGIAHRDLKPENIMLVSRRAGFHVKIVDLGIAKVVREHEHRGKTSVPIGTPIYMAPEVIVTQGLPADGYFSADIYSIGVILYEMLTGSPPFEGEAAQVIYQKVEQDPPRPRERVRGLALPERVEALVMRCLARRPEERVRSVEALAVALRDLPQRSGTPPPPPREETRRMSSPPRLLNELHAADGRLEVQEDGNHVELTTTHIRAHERGPHLLGISRVEKLLPAPLLCTYVNRTLSVYCDSSEHALRAALYLDASEPATRLERLHLTESSPPQAFDLGHRRHVTRRIHCQVLPCRGQPVEATLSPALSLSLAPPPWASSLVALWVPSDDGERVHLECICLERDRA
ncbi:MAG: serine/threonine-protein kinase [Nannocystaceae bacterium]